MISSINCLPKNQPEGNNNNNVNNTKSIQLGLLGKQLIDDIIHEVSLAEAAKMSASSFSSASTAVPRNNNNINHGGDDDASARFVHSRHQTGSGHNGFVPPPMPRQETM